MVPEAVAELAAPQLSAGAAKPPSFAAGYNFSLVDIARFEAAYAGRTGAAAGAPGESEAAVAPRPGSMLDSPAMRAVIGPLDRINQDALKLAEDTNALAGNDELTPGQILMLTVRCHEFMFHCQMTSNVANRTSDGVQQLFRQQT